MPIATSIRAALVLALIAVVPVGLALMVEPPASVLENADVSKGPIDWRPIPLPGAVALALATVIPAALVGGGLGWSVWLWRRFPGAVVALMSAWATGIVVLPAAAALLGVHLRTAIVCLMSCDPILRSDDPFSGFVGYFSFFFGSIVFGSSVWLVPALVIFALYVLVSWARRRPATPPSIPLPVLIVVFAALHGLGLWFAAAYLVPALVPYVLLTAGVLVWAVYLERVDASRRPAADAAVEVESVQSRAAPGPA